MNIAYEAATADLRDVNMIDPYHLDAYNVATVNYNRDVDAFPVVKTILQRITGKDDLYRSPTDMGVNMVGNCIVDDDVCREAAHQEILRRYYKAWCDYKNGATDIETAHRVELLMKNVGITTNDRRVVKPALDKAAQVDCPVCAIELPDGKIVTGKEISLMSKQYYLNLGVISVPIPYFAMSATCMGLKNGLYIYMLRQYFRGIPKSTCKIIKKLWNTQEKRENISKKDRSIYLIRHSLFIHYFRCGLDQVWHTRIHDPYMHSTDFT